ncbi:MAG: hypothetical protein Q7R45_08360 [Sulfuricaulis sp.]|nr:hypothetical protein [Sulfuricaulis sp.]
MSRKRKLGKLPDLNDVRSTMMNAISHFNFNNEDIDKMAKAVKRLYEGRIAERVPDYYEALRRFAANK